MLSQTTHLRRSLFQLYHLLETISPLFFIPLVPYPPLRGTFPSRGRLCSSIAVLSYRSLPHWGRLCSWIAVLSYRSLPHWGRGTALAVDRVLSLIADLRRISPLIFHTVRTLSGSLRSPPSPRGEGFVSRIALFSYRSLPHWGRGTAQRWIGCSRISST